MTLPIAFANAEVLVIDYLDTYFDIPVRATVPDPRPDDFMLVRRAGGVADIVYDGPILAIEAWVTGDPVQAEANLQYARRKLHELGGRMLASYPVYRVQEVGGPAYLPDPDSDHDRYTMTIQLRIRGWAAYDEGSV